MLKIGALEFLVVGEDGDPWKPMQAWAVPRAGARIDDQSAWDLTLVPPQGPALPLHDLKRWMLFGTKDVRWLVLPAAGKNTTQYRKIVRNDATIRYLKAVRAALPASRRADKISILVPAGGDQDTRKRYLDTVKEAYPDSRVFPEPEMVVEYFRLVQRSLTLDEERNNVILVIDIGASTSNLTIVVSNRDDVVVGAETGRQRAARLRAIQGTSGDAAGQWVDEWLARHAGIQLDHLDHAERHSLLARFEAAKIEVSSTGRSVIVAVPGAPEPWTMTVEDIEMAAYEVATGLLPVLQQMATRLWEQSTSTDTALRMTEKIRSERSVNGPADALRLVDYVLLAGGTSRLSGFREVLESEFRATKPRFLEVGDSFPIAAAVGALAHVLHAKYSPRRIRSAAADDAEAAPLEGALDLDIEFAWKPDPGRGELEERVTVIERGDPIVYTGGERNDVFILPVDANTKLRARLIPDVKSQRRGLPPNDIFVEAPNPRFGFRIDSDQRLKLLASSITGLANLRLDLKRFDTVHDPSEQPYEGSIPSGILALDYTDEVVIDFGMSKTVVVAATAGLLDPHTLEKRPDPPPPSPVSPTSDSADAPPTEAPPVPEDPVRVSLLPVTPDPPPPPSSPEQDLTQPDAPPPTRPNGSGVLRRTLDGFMPALNEFLRAADAARVDVPAADLLFTLLGLAVRPLVLLAGPPGSGKSTLARIVAHLLGRRIHENFHEIPVQAHWMDDDPLFREDGLLSALLEHPDDTHLVLFDEINLTRPEYYLTRLFYALDAPTRMLTANQRLAHTLGIGTLNIDDTSRAPSPKVLDRCFLVEVDQILHNHALQRDSALRLASLPTLPGLPDAHASAPAPFEPRIDALLQELQRVVQDDGLREDLLPSRRVLTDIRCTLALHAELGEDAAVLLPTDQLLDRLITARILIKVAGSVEQVEPVLQCLESFCSRPENAIFKRTRRRLNLSHKQKKLGFISPWQ